MKKVVIYTRISTGEQNLDSQINDLINYCKNKEYQVVRVFEDIITGASVQLHRESFKEMDLFLSENEDIKDIIVWELSRIGRSLFNTFEIIQNYRKRGINIYFKKENLNTLETTNDDDLRLNILSSIAEYERNQIKERTQRGIINSIKKGGGFKGIYLPFGYSKDENGKLIINKNEADIIKLMFKLYLNNDYTFQQIANHLNSNNIQTKFFKIKDEIKFKNEKLKKSEGIWTKSSVSKVLKNKMLIGYRYSSLTDLEYNKSLHIIDNEIFDEVQRKIEKNKINNSNAQKHNNILKNVVFTSNNNIMHLNISLKEKLYQNKKDGIAIDADLLNNAVYFFLQNAVRDDSEYNNKINIINDKINNYQTVNENYNAAIKKENEKLKSLYRDKLNDIINNDLFKEFSDEINNKITKLNSVIRKNNILINKFKDEIKILKKSDNYKFSNPEVFKKYVKNIIDFVIVNKLEIDRNKLKELFPDLKRSKVYSIKINTNGYGYYECLVNKESKHFHIIVGDIFNDDYTINNKMLINTKLPDKIKIE